VSAQPIGRFRVKCLDLRSRKKCLFYRPVGNLLSERLAAVRRILERQQLDAVLTRRAALGRYLSGFTLARGEEATSGWSGSCLISADAQILLADARYTEQAEHEAVGWQVRRTIGQIEEDLPPILAELGERRSGLEAEVIPHATWQRLTAAAEGVDMVAVDEELAALRIRKSADEVATIERACELTDRCWTHLLGIIEPGMTELAVAWELEDFFRRNGADGLAFDPLVLAGPRAAMPHGRPGASTVERGNVLLVDFGCQVDGYRSDMTRTVMIGEPDDELRNRYQLVREAQSLAAEAARPGMTGRELDAEARQHLAEAGYAEAFTHGLGHGIGLETHEPPSVRRTSDTVLEAGMVFSIEPGIYLPGVTGIRIEDIVELTPDGARHLTRSARELTVL
jgi:Xaa-Pro aminopeptidase